MKLVILFFLEVILSYFYLSQGKGIGYDDGDRLHKFAEDNDLEGVASLLKQGIDPNTKEEEHGRTAIHRAAKEGNMKVVELLLEFGADVDARAKSDSTALHYASNMGHEEIATLLLNKGADVNARNEFGRTPLQYAANFKHINVVTLLLDHGADINAQDTSGRNALHYAVAVEHKDTVKLLLDRGISRFEKTKRGETALDLADNDGIRFLLQSYFATEL